MATELKPCPNCRSRLLFRGVHFRIGTPKHWVRIKSCFGRKRVTCLMCGCSKRNAIEWNRRAE